MSVNRFANLMSDLLQEMKMQKPDGLHQKVCTLHFNGKPSIHFINHVSKYVDVMSEAGVLGNPVASGTLQELLALNSIDGMAWPTSVTLHRPTNTLVVWCRHVLATVEIPALLETMRCINTKLHAIQRLVTHPAPRREAKSAGALLRMAGFQRGDSN